MLRRCVWQLPLRAAAGGFILNSGLSKRDADEDTAGQLHGFASGTYPFLRRIEAGKFTRVQSVGEMTIGSIVLFPLVPARVAGAVLTGFAASLLGLYLRTPGMREEGSLRPTEQGLPLAKDSWLLAIGLSLLTGGPARPRD